jgi:integrase
MKQINVDCASKPRTIKFYKEKLARLLEFRKLADKRLDLIDSVAVEAYKRHRMATVSRRGTPMSPASINRELATLKRALRVAVDEKKILAVPRIRLMKGEHSREFVLSPEDESRYLAALAPQMRTFCAFLVETGLRVGEAIALEWRQVYLKTGDAYITVKAGHAKNGKARSVPLTRRAQALLAAISGRQSLVFGNSEGVRLYHTWLCQQHVRVRELLGFPVDFVLHSLRHTFGSRLGNAGAEAFAIMNLMGHSSVTVSQKYVHPSTESMRRAIELMGAASDHHTFRRCHQAPGPFIQHPAHCFKTLSNPG